MIFEIISILLLIDSGLGFIIGFTKLGDNSIEQMSVIKRYLPLTKGWTALYFAVSLYVTYLTFVVL